MFWLRFSIKIWSKSKKGHFWHVFMIIEWSRFFLGKRAPSVFFPNCPLTYCQVSLKSLERFSVTFGRTHTHTIFWGYGSTEVENCNVEPGPLALRQYLLNQLNLLNLLNISNLLNLLNLLNNRVFLWLFDILIRKVKIWKFKFWSKND